MYLDVHGLAFETSICYWQDQPGITDMQSALVWSDCCHVRLSAETHSPCIAQGVVPVATTCFNKASQLLRRATTAVSISLREIRELLAGCTCPVSYLAARSALARNGALLRALIRILFVIICRRQTLRASLVNMTTHSPSQPWTDARSCVPLKPVVRSS